jgi:TadE-like protein
VVHRVHASGLPCAGARAVQGLLQGSPSTVVLLPSHTAKSREEGWQPPMVRLRPRFLKDRRRTSRAQSLVEFALILPILLMLVGGIVQYGALFATKHSLIQVARDLGRWASTQTVDSSGTPLTNCSDVTSASPAQPVTQANAIAMQSRLMGYSDGAWYADPLQEHFKAYADRDALEAATPPSTEAVEVAWTSDGGTTCPPSDSTQTSWVTIRLTHRAPVLLPGFPYLPGLGTCDSTGCYFVVTTIAEFRMEPVDAP